jgi:peptidyl-prolyl cis-trans isomerase A (cyclophilin A)
MSIAKFLKQAAVILSFLCLGATTCLAAEAGTAANGGTQHMANRIAVIETNLGTIELELFEDKTPITTKNFIDLAEKGFYDGVIFHRVIDGFMIQGGDPTGTGMGGPDYTIEDEFRDDLKFSGDGILAMANTGMPHTGGSQFFITLAATPWLNGHHTIFGKVVKGMDVVKKIGHTETDYADRPVEDVVMKSVTIKDAE